jgi:hypothetical protein
VKRWAAFAFAIGVATVIAAKSDERAEEKPAPTELEKLEAAYRKARDSQKAAIRAQPRDDEKLADARLAVGRAFDDLYGFANRTMKPELDAATEFYREPRDEVFRYAVGLREQLQGKKIDVSIRSILDAAGKTAGAQKFTPHSRPMWGFCSGYKAYRESGLSHLETISRMSKD